MKMKYCNTRQYLLLFIFLIKSLVLSATINIDITQAPYNAIPNDGLPDSQSFQLAFDALKANGGGYLYIPSGGFVIDSQISLTIRTGDNIDGIMIEGEPNTSLFCQNPDGFLEIFFNQERHCQVTLKNFSIVAAHIVSNEPKSAGTAIRIYHKDSTRVGWLGLAEHRAVICTNVKVRSLGSCPDCYFDKGFVVTGFYRPVFSDCQFISPFTTPDLIKLYIPSVGFDVEDCYYPSFERCVVKGSKVGYSMNSAIFPDTNPTIHPPEAGIFKYCEIDHVNEGIIAEIKYDREPTIWITNCEIKAKISGIRMKGRRIFHITDNKIYRLSTTAFTDIQLINSSL